MKSSATRDQDNQYLRSDNIFEILSRSSLSTLGRCRQLCKEINALTYESSFMNLHCQRSKILSGYFLQSMQNNCYSSTFVSIEDSSNNQVSLEFLPVPVQIIASTLQGFLLCVDERLRIPSYYVCKPSTNERQCILNPKTKYFTVGMDMIVLRLNPLHYKIVRFSKPKSQPCCHKLKDYIFCLRCEIFDSETMEWKQLQHIKLPYDEFLTKERSVSSCGSLHWFTSKNNILAFHEDKEEHSVFSLPSLVYVSDHYDRFRMMEYEGKLALVCGGKEGFVDLWVMENYEQKLWNKRWTISLQSVRREEPYTNIVSLYNAEVALVNGYYRVLFFKFKNGNNIKEVNLGKDIDDHLGIFPFQSDLKPCGLKNEFVKKNELI